MRHAIQTFEALRMETLRFKIRVHKPPGMDSVRFPRYYEHLTALLEGAHKQLPENAARLGSGDQSRAWVLVTHKGMGLGPLAKPVILGTRLAPLCLSSFICKLGTVTSTFPKGSWGESDEIMRVKAALCELPFIAQTKVLLPAGHLCPWL